MAAIFFRSGDSQSASRRVSNTPATAQKNHRSTRPAIDSTSHYSYFNVIITIGKKQIHKHFTIYQSLKEFVMMTYSEPSVADDSWRQESNGNNGSRLGFHRKQLLSIQLYLHRDLSIITLDCKMISVFHTVYIEIMKLIRHRTL